ncbi:MAG: hypothetical protein ACRDTV_23770, partial [Mycobacterium sp.]
GSISDVPELNQEIARVFIADDHVEIPIYDDDVIDEDGIILPAHVMVFSAAKAQRLARIILHAVEHIEAGS